LIVNYITNQKLKNKISLKNCAKTLQANLNHQYSGQPGTNKNATTFVEAFSGSGKNKNAPTYEGAF